MIGISGDFEQDGLGLSVESRKTLTQNVSIIYHAAATVRFDEDIRKAVKVNVGGTQEIIKLAKECKRLDVLTYMGTAYSNCPEKVIKEEFYPPAADPQDVIKFVENSSSDKLNELTSRLIGKYPNTYAFTKQLAEDVVRKNSLGIPTCIQRPAIVIASVNEPVPSWVESIYGPVGIMLAAGVGLIHVWLGNTKLKCELVPADYVINHCIAASYKTAMDRFTDKVQIFNFTPSASNPAHWNYLDLTRESGSKMGMTKCLVSAFYQSVTSWYLFVILSFIFHTIPGYFIDRILMFAGKKPLLTKAYVKIHKYAKIYSYFTLSEWTFELANTEKLWNGLNANDKEIFPFNMESLDWHDYFDTYAPAMRELLVKEFLDNLEEGRTYYRRLVVISYVLLLTVLVLPAYFWINTKFCFIPMTIISLFFFFIVDF